MIEQRINSLRQIAECPANAFRHWLKAVQFKGFTTTDDRQSQDLLGFPNVILETVAAFEVPRGQALILTNVNHILIANQAGLLDVFTSNVVFYWEVNDKRKTAAKTLIEMLNGDCFLVFNAKDRVKLRAILTDISQLASLQAGTVNLTTRLDGFLCEPNLTERLKPLETIFS